MYAAVVGELRVKCRHPHRPLTTQHRRAVVESCQHLHTGPDPFHSRGTDENRRKRGGQAIDVHERLATLHLTPEPIASHSDVDRRVPDLVVSAVVDVCGQKDHPRACAKSGYPRGDVFPKFGPEPGGLEQNRQRRAFATGHDYGVECDQ